MARKRKDRGSSQGEFEDFVPAVFARSAQEAEEYRELLNDHDIPAIVETGGEIAASRAGLAARPLRTGISRGVPILVPEVLLDEASEVIADRDYEDYRPGDEDLGADDEDEEEELSPEPPPRRKATEEDEEKPPRKRRSADDPFDEDEEAFVLEDDEEEPDDLDDDKEEDEEKDEEEEPE